MKNLQTAILMSALGLTGVQQAQGQETDLRLFTDPDSRISFGGGYLIDESRRYALFSGVDDRSAFGQLSIDYLSRNDSLDSWLAVTGRNLGLSTPELRLSYERGDDWSVELGFNRITRREPLIVTTGLTGIGTATQAIGGGPLSNYDFSSRRNRLDFAADKSFASRFKAAVNFTHEEKTGTRIFGRGTGQLLAEPLDSRHESIDAQLSYVGERFQATGGYYGSAFTAAVH
jgi:Putative outer membrane beta-barrel porin, MtrB/PioB